MTITEADYINVADRAAQLGCNMPTGFAAMPANFETADSRQDLLLRGEATTIRTLLRNANLPIESFLPSGEAPGFVHNKSHHWEAVLFVSAGVLSQNSAAVSIALGLITNYLTDYFKGEPQKQIKFSVITEVTPDRTYKEINYEGDVAGLIAIADAVARIADE